MLNINNNVAANSVSRFLSDNYKGVQSSIEKLSSGLRINKAADDAAGLAISELMRADVVAMSQGRRNANDAVSLVQTADGALQGINENLVRMKELAVQASSGTLTADQRAIIDVEYQALAAEVTRVTKATEFNGQKLLDGSLSPESGGESMKIHFGPSNGSTDSYDVTLSDLSAESLGLGENAPAGSAGANMLTQGSASNALGAIDEAIKKVTSAQGHIGSMANRLDSTISTLAIQEENLMAAESRIRDVDVAYEMTNFSKNQILLQSSVSMLAQANSMPSYANSLVS